MHYGMFAENTADPNDFLALLASATGSDPEIIPVVMKHNACHIYCPTETAQGKHGHKKARAERARQAAAGTSITTGCAAQRRRPPRVKRAGARPLPCLTFRPDLPIMKHPF